MRELADTFGGLTLPIDTVAPPNEGFAGQDPARKVLIDLFAAALNAELGPRWASVVGTFGPGHVLSGSTPVRYKLEMAPTPNVLEQVKVTWPLLALHRDGQGEYSQHTLALDKLVQQWQLHHILGPLGIEDVRRVGGVCDLAGKIITAVLRNRGHASYDNGAAQFGTGKGDLAVVRLVSHEGPGQAAFVGDDKNVLYWAITFTLETTELLRENPDAYGSYEGSGFDFSIGGGEGTIDGLMYGDTDSL